MRAISSIDLWFPFNAPYVSEILNPWLITVLILTYGTFFFLQLDSGELAINLFDINSFPLFSHSSHTQKCISF